MTISDKSGLYYVVGEPVSTTPLLLHRSLSSVRLYHSVSAVGCFCALWPETLLQALRYFVLPKRVCSLLKIDIRATYVV
jgi:hypothetical protein